MTTTFEVYTETPLNNYRRHQVHNDSVYYRGVYTTLAYKTAGFTKFTPAKPIALCFTRSIAFQDGCAYPRQCVSANGPKRLSIQVSALSPDAQHGGNHILTDLFNIKELIKASKPLFFSVNVFIAFIIQRT